MFLVFPAQISSWNMILATKDLPIPTTVWSNAIFSTGEFGKNNLSASRSDGFKDFRGHLLSLCWYQGPASIGR